MNRIETKLDGLLREKEQSEREWEVNKLHFTIANPEWWEWLTSEQHQDAMKALKEANKVAFGMLGLSLQLVTYTKES